MAPPKGRRVTALELKRDLEAAGLKNVRISKVLGDTDISTTFEISKMRNAINGRAVENRDAHANLAALSHFLPRAFPELQR